MQIQHLSNCTTLEGRACSCGTASTRTETEARAERGVQPEPRAAAMVSEAAELLELYGDHMLGDL